MSIGTLATVLSVLFVLSLIALACELLYVLCRHRSFRRRSSPLHHDESPIFTLTDAATKELLYFFLLKPHPPAELDPPSKHKDGSSPTNDQVVDVTELVDANGQSKIVGTLEKDDKKDELELKSDVDFLNEPGIENGDCLQSGEEVVAVMVESDDGNTETVFSTPCDSPMYFTPVGSPARDFLEPVFVCESDHR